MTHVHYMVGSGIARRPHLRQDALSRGSDGKGSVMIANTSLVHRVSATYSNGQPYSISRGRYAPRMGLEDRLAVEASVVQGRPTAAQFWDKIVRELRIRFYQPKTIKNAMP